MNLRYAFIIVCLLFLFSCDTKKSGNGSDETGVDSIHLIINDTILDGKMIHEYLEEPDMDPLVAKYLKGEFVPGKDVELTNTLLDTLLNHDGAMKSVYFRAYNQICKEYGQEMSDLLGNYSMRMLEEHTAYCVRELSKGAPDYFTGFVSNNLYQKPDWKSELDLMSETLYKNLGTEDTALVHELDDLLEGIANDIQHLQEEDTVTEE